MSLQVFTDVHDMNSLHGEKRLPQDELEHMEPIHGHQERNEWDR